MEGHPVFILCPDGNRHTPLAGIIRDTGALAVFFPLSVTAEKLRSLSPAAIIIPHADDLSRLDAGIFSLGIPMMTFGEVTYRMIAALGGSVTSRVMLRYAGTESTVELDQETQLRVNSDRLLHISCAIPGGITQLPAGFSVIARSDMQTIIAVENREKHIVGITLPVQNELHPTLRAAVCAFLRVHCAFFSSFNPESARATLVAGIRRHVGGRSVLTALYPTIGSVVTTALLAEALPGQVTAILIDNGLMRENEIDDLLRAFAPLSVRIRRVSAGDRFLPALNGAVTTEDKNRIIRDLCGDIFTEEAAALGKFDVFSFCDVYESILEQKKIPPTDSIAAEPDDLCRRLGIPDAIAPLGIIFSEEARKIGTLLGLPRRLMNRRFGPLAGVSVRISGELTAEKIAILRAGDRIVREEIERSRRIRLGKVFIVLLESPLRESKNSYIAAIVTERSNETGGRQFAQLPYPLLAHISARLTAELPQIKRVFYDISSDPAFFPDQIDWE